MTVFYQRFDFKPSTSAKLKSTQLSPHEIASRMVQEGYALRFSAEDFDGFPKAIVVVSEDSRDPV